MSGSAQLKHIVKQNTQVLDIFSSEDLIDAWEQKTGSEIAEVIGLGGRQAANYAAAVLDVKTATKLIKDLGARG